MVAHRHQTDPFSDPTLQGRRGSLDTPPAAQWAGIGPMRRPGAAPSVRPGSSWPIQRGSVGSTDHCLHANGGLQGGGPWLNLYVIRRVVLAAGVAAPSDAVFVTRQRQELLPLAGPTPRAQKGRAVDTSAPSFCDVE